MGRVGQHANSKDGCDREDDVCGVNDINGHKCGVNGKCVGSFLFHKYECQCDPGWRGPKCIIRESGSLLGFSVFCSQING